MDILTYEAELPDVPEGTDVETQRLTVSVDGVASEPVALTVDTDTYQFDVPQNSEFVLSMVHVDDAGNESEAVVAGPFTAIDTIAPQAPGGFGEIRLVAERREEVVPEPTPEPPVEE